MEGAPRNADAALWLRLLGFALLPLAVQGLSLRFGSDLGNSLGSALGILTPLPLAYGTARRGTIEGLGAMCVVALAASLAMGPEAGLFFIVETVPLCLAIAWTARTSRPLHGAVAVSTALVALTVAAAAALYGMATGEGPLSVYREIASRAGQVMDTVPAGPDMPPEARAQLQWVVGIWTRLFFGIWVATLVLLITMFSLMVRSWLFAAGRAAAAQEPPLSSWRMPFPFVWAFIALAAGVILGKGDWRYAALNAFIPLAALYGIQGLVVSSYLLNRWAVPLVLRVLVLVFVAFQAPTWLMVGVALAGLFDTWFDFRRRFPPRAPSPPAQKP